MDCRNKEIVYLDNSDTEEYCLSEAGEVVTRSKYKTYTVVIHSRV